MKAEWPYSEYWMLMKIVNAIDLAVSLKRADNMALASWRGHCDVTMAEDWSASHLCWPATGNIMSDMSHLTHPCHKPAHILTYSVLHFANRKSLAPQAWNTGCYGWQLAGTSLFHWCAMHGHESGINLEILFKRISNHSISIRIDRLLSMLNLEPWWYIEGYGSYWIFFCHFRQAGTPDGSDMTFRGTCLYCADCQTSQSHLF